MVIYSRAPAGVLGGQHLASDGGVPLPTQEPRPAGHGTTRGSYKKRINTEEKEKVVAAVWGTEHIQFLAALAVLHWDDLKNRMNCTRMI